MTDEQMDARLRAAGERWRAEHTTVATVEPAVITEQPAEITARPPHRRRRGLIASAALVAAALVVGGTLLLRDVGNGGVQRAGDTAALEGHVWLLQGVKGTASTATLYIDRDGNLVADDECRLIGGSVAIDGSTMTVSKQVVRYKSCTDQYGTGYYDDGTAVLNGASTFGITSDGLTISSNRKELRFTLAPDGTPVPTLDFPTLVGADWALVSAKGANGHGVTVAGNPTLHIDDSGNLTGTDGCNSLQGTVTMNADQITFGNVGGTEKYCPGDEGATEQAILAVMQGTAREVVSGGQLTITKGQAELGYRWAPTSAATDPHQLYGTTWTLIDNAGTAVPVGAKLSVCPPRSDGCIGCNWAVAAGTMSADPGPDCTARTPLEELFGVGRSVVWSVYNNDLLLYLNDSQGSALVFTNGAAPPPSTVQLVGPTWHLVSIKSGDGRYRNGATSPDTSTLTFTDHTVTERHTCYGQSGDVEITSTTIALSNMHNTYANPCPYQAGRDAAANLVDTILAGTLTWSIDGGTLTLQKGDSTLTYSASPSNTANDPLTGTDWRLETAVDKDGNDHPANNLQFSINSGKLLADDGTNEINADVQVSDETLTLSNVTVGGVGGTRPDPVTTTVDDVLAQGDVEYQIDGDALTLTRGAEQLIYRAGPDTPVNSSAPPSSTASS